MLPQLISAGASLLGGFLSRSAQGDANDRAAAEKQKDRELSLQFAQNGIRWKADDARAAGLHPLAALGAGSSYSGGSMSFTPETGLATGLAAAGQDVGRAINATRSQPERDQAFNKTVQDLTLTRMGLENELLSSKLGLARSAQTNPPAPAGTALPIPEKSKHDEIPQMYIGGQRIVPDRTTSNMESFEDRYGDDGPASWILPWIIGYNDLRKNSASADRFHDQMTRVDPRIAAALQYMNSKADRVRHAEPWWRDDTFRERWTGRR